MAYKINVTPACPNCNHIKYKILETMVVTEDSDNIRAINIDTFANTTTDYSSKEFFLENVGTLKSHVKVKVKCLNCLNEYTLVVGQDF